nr:hypothetical protein [Paenibacillus protaetiae]
MGLTTALPLGSLYNMSKFALEGLTEGLYYELKPFNIELRLVEQGGSSGNQFADKVVWNTDEKIKVYDELIAKVKHRMKSADRSELDDPQLIVEVIDKLATREINTFRNVVGDAGHALMKMRNSMPIEQYLETIAKANL